MDIKKCMVRHLRRGLGISLVGLLSQTLDASQAAAPQFEPLSNISFINDSAQTVYIYRDKDFIAEVPANIAKAGATQLAQGATQTGQTITKGMMGALFGRK